MDFVRNLFNYFSRLVAYQTMKLFIVQMLPLMIPTTEVNEFDANVMTRMPMNEMMAVLQYQQYILVILLRSAARDLLKDDVNVLLLYRTLYVLVMYWCDTSLYLKYALYSLFKVVLRHVVVWTVGIMNKKVAVYNYIDPKRINAPLSFEQIDLIEFNGSIIYTILGVCRGMFLEMLQHWNIFKILKKWYTRN